MDQPPCPLNLGNSISASNKFARGYTGNQLTHYPRGAEQLAPKYCNGLVTDFEMIMQPVFWAYMQETQV